MAELQRHLQFVEEEAELLRRSLLEMEEQNKLLMNELNRYKSEQDPDEDSVATAEDGCSPSSEELLHAHLQIGELSGKVKKLQYENRVLLSNLQRCDLASYHHSRLSMETDAEAGDSAECVPCQLQREGPVGGENDALEEQEKKAAESDRSSGGGANIEEALRCLRLKDYEALLEVRDQARLVHAAIQLLTASNSSWIFSSPYLKSSPLSPCPNDATEQGPPEKNTTPGAVLEALTGRLATLQAQLLSFVERVESLGSTGGEQVQGAQPEPDGTVSGDPPRICSPDGQAREGTVEQKQPDFRDQSEQRVKGQDAYLGKAEEANNKESDKEQDSGQLKEKDNDSAETEQIRHLQTLLSEAREGARGAFEQLSQERRAHKEDAQKVAQLQEEHQKALARRDFQLQSLSLQTRLQQKFWSQERNLMVQESQQLQQSLLLFGLKLRCFLKQWRLGRKLGGDGKDILEVNSVKDLRLLLEEEGLASHQADNKASAVEEPSSPGSKEQIQLDRSVKQAMGLSSTMADLKGALQELSAELQQERQGSQELTQQFARAKASWEVERTELKSHVAQLESKVGRPGLAAEKEGPELKAVLKREREEHQHLLADSYAAVMDLTKQLQIGERNWSREKVELLEHFNQERSQLEQRLRDSQGKGGLSQPDKISEKESNTSSNSSRTHTKRTKSIATVPELESILDSCCLSPGQEVDGTNDKERKGQPGLPPSLLTHSDLSDLNKKNWKYLTNEMALLEKGDLFKTWDCPSTTSSFPGVDLSPESVQRSYTAPDKTGIRIYYSPPVVRRMERRLAQETLDAQLGSSPNSNELQEPGDEGESSASTYDRWLYKISKQHRDLLENRPTGMASASLPSSFHDLEISGNLSDDMKEMTNCVRQAIRSSSLERKCKDIGCQTVGVASTGTQTAQFVSVGLQTEGPRGGSLHSKSWSPRVSSLASARSRQISTSLDKVHSRIERPCCSPKYGSPKLQRRVSSSSSKLDSSKDRSLWNLHHRGHSGSAWARSTTTRDSPVLSGINDGLSSLFSVVEHSGSMESLWKVDTGNSPGIKPAGKPSTEPGVHRYGIVHEFFRNVCGRAQTPTPAGGERPHREGIPADEVKPECPVTAALAGNDNITKIVNKRFMKQPQKDEQAQISLEDAPCECASQSLTSCFARSSRSVVRHSLGHCKLRSMDSTEEKVEVAHE